MAVVMGGQAGGLLGEVVDDVGADVGVRKGGKGTRERQWKKERDRERVWGEQSGSRVAGTVTGHWPARKREAPR